MTLFSRSLRVYWSPDVPYSGELAVGVGRAQEFVVLFATKMNARSKKAAPSELGGKKSLQGLLVPKPERKGSAVQYGVDVIGKLSAEKDG